MMRQTKAFRVVLLVRIRGIDPAVQIALGIGKSKPDACCAAQYASSLQLLLVVRRQSWERHATLREQLQLISSR